jgi:hypothetical protein
MIFRSESVSDQFPLVLVFSLEMGILNSANLLKINDKEVL